MVAPLFQLITWKPSKFSPKELDGFTTSGFRRFMLRESKSKLPNDQRKFVLYDNVSLTHPEREMHGPYADPEEAVKFAERLERNTK
jgi:hypothetical protein